MFALNHNQFVSFAAAGAFVTLTAFSIPARADELAQNLGPVGPHEPILTTVGNKRVIAFYVPGSGHCALHVVMWDNANVDTEVSAARVLISVEPGQIVHIDSAENESLNLQCGESAEKLAVVDTDNLIAFGVTTQRPGQPIRAIVVPGF